MIVINTSLLFLVHLGKKRNREKGGSFVWNEVWLSIRKMVCVTIFRFQISIHLLSVGTRRKICFCVSWISKIMLVSSKVLWIQAIFENLGSVYYSPLIFVIQYCCWNTIWTPAERKKSIFTRTEGTEKKINHVWAVLVFSVQHSSRYIRPVLENPCSMP